MLGMLACLVFAAAGCIGVAVIAASVRSALPALRRLNAERATLAADRVFLVTLIETPRHDGTPPPRAILPGDPAPTARVAVRPLRRTARVPLRAAA